MSKKTDKKVPQPGRPKNLKLAIIGLFKKLRPYRVAIIVAIIISAISSIPTIFSPKIVEEMTFIIIKMADALGDPTGPGMTSLYNDLFKLGIIAMAIVLGGFVLWVIDSLIMNEVTQRAAKGLRTEISQKINKVPLSYFDKESFGDVLSRVTNDVDVIAQNLSQTFTDIVSSVVGVIGLIIMMLASSWQLAIVVILSVPISMTLLVIVMGFSQKYFVRQQKILGSINGHIEEVYSSHSVIKVFNASEEVKPDFVKYNNDLRKVGLKSSFFMGLMGPIISFMNNVSYVAVLITAGILISKGSITVPLLTSFLIYVRLFANPTVTLAQAGGNLQSTAAATERVLEFLDVVEMEDESHKNKVVENFKGKVELKHVKFGYNEDRLIIKDFNVLANPGEKIAIVGPTGAGKTTLVNLLMRFYEFDGDILIDGISTKEMKKEEVRKLFGMVLQDTWLFEGTIYDNLVYNTPNTDKDKVMKAANMANVHHYIESLPGGYDMVLSETANISQGQRQLLTIARAMVQNAPMLILDEATSNVDTRTEQLIQDAMDTLMKGRTSFVIAHRLSTIKNANKILVMKDGDIFEIGSHEELLAKNGFYAELYNSQFESMKE